MKNTFVPAVAVASFLLWGMAIAQPAQSGIDPDYPTTVSNMNIWKLYTDYQVLLEEIDKSVSKKNAGLLSHDSKRWIDKLNAMRADVDYWASQAYLDLPVTHGTDWDITDPLNPPCVWKDATAICQVMALLKSARDEIVLSASAGIPMHLYPQDEARQKSYWDAVVGYLGHIATQLPLDEPVTAAEENLGLLPGFDHTETE